MKEKCFKLCHILIVVAVILTSVNLSVFFGGAVSAAGYSKTTAELVLKSSVDTKRIVTITSWDSDNCTFKATKNGVDVTAAITNNITTAGGSINKAASKVQQQSTTETVDLGWIGEAIGFFGYNESKLPKSNSNQVLAFKKGNGQVDYILMDDKGYSFCKDGLAKMLGYEALESSIAVYEYKASKALSEFEMFGSGGDYAQNCKKAGLSASFSYILSPIKGKLEKNTGVVVAKDFQFVEQNGSFLFFVNKLFLTQGGKYAKGGEEAFAINITKSAVGDEKIPTASVCGDNYDLPEENYLVNTLFPIVYISSLTKESDSSYSIYKEGSNKTLVNAAMCTPEVTGKETYRFDTRTNKIYKYNEANGEATEVTDVAKMQLPKDMLYICSFNMEAKATQGSSGSAGIVFREMFEVVSYTLEGTDYTDFTGRKIILDGASGINPDKATGSMVTSTMENLKPKWYLTDNKFTCGFDETYGVTIQLKGKYAEESGLSEWINSEQGEKALNNLSVDIERLKKGLSSVLSLNVEDRFSWWDIQRFDEITDELSRGKQAKIYNAAFMICMIGGIIIIVYSILLIVCFFIDILNPFTERSLYNLLTFGRVMPLPTQEDVDSMGGESGGTKYISHKGMITSFITGVVVGIILLNSRNIYIFIVNTYQWVLSWF